MKFVTEIWAIDPFDGELKIWFGPYIDAISFSDARRYCDDNGLGYLTVTGVLVAEVEPDGTITNHNINEN